MTRKEAREQAFILIFEKEISKLEIEDVLTNAADARDVITDDFSLTLFEGVFAKLEEIDQEISAHLQGWRPERLSKVVLALLRLCVFEMRFLEDVPVSVSINEAVELCKKYATDEDTSYLNGVLGSIARVAEK